jgi:hypothetical protein
MLCLVQFPSACFTRSECNIPGTVRHCREVVLRQSSLVCRKYKPGDVEMSLQRYAQITVFARIISHAVRTLLLRAQRASFPFSPRKTGEQTKPNLARPEFAPQILDAFFLRHFSIHGPKSLAMDGLRCSLYFCPKKIGQLSAFAFKF